MDASRPSARGPAFLAWQARQALGVVLEPRPLADIPPPLVHTAFGAAVCAVAVLVRPEVLGQERSALASAALAVCTGMLLAGYDRLVYPAGRRPGVDAVALPVAAVAAFATVLAGVPAGAQQLPVRAVAGLVAGLVIGGVPRLAGRQATGRAGVAARLLRDIAGMAVLAPVLVAGTSTVLPVLPRLGLVTAVTALVSFDGLRGERLIAPTAALGALVAGFAVAGAAYLAAPAVAPSRTRAAALLVLWYGVRGVVAAAVTPGSRRRVLSVGEYAVFVVVGVGALRWLLLAP